MDDLSRRLSAVGEPLFLTPPGEIREALLAAAATPRRQRRRRRIVIQQKRVAAQEHLGLRRVELLGRGRLHQEGFRERDRS